MTLTPALFADLLMNKHIRTTPRADNVLLTSPPDMLEEGSCGVVEGGQRGVAEGLHTLL